MKPSRDTPDYAEFESWKEDRNRALRELDMGYAKVMMPASKEEVRLIAMHKARYECTEIEPHLREASREWLEDHKYNRLHGTPWPPIGVLPK